MIQELYYYLDGLLGCSTTSLDAFLLDKTNKMYRAYSDVTLEKDRRLDYSTFQAYYELWCNKRFHRPFKQIGSYYRERQRKSEGVDSKSGEGDSKILQFITFNWWSSIKRVIKRKIKKVWPNAALFQPGGYMGAPDLRVGGVMPVWSYVDCYLNIRRKLPSEESTNADQNGEVKAMKQGHAGSLRAFIEAKYMLSTVNEDFIPVKELEAECRHFCAKYDFESPADSSFRGDMRKAGFRSQPREILSFLVMKGFDRSATRLKIGQRWRRRCQKWARQGSWVRRQLWQILLAALCLILVFVLPVPAFAFVFLLQSEIEWYFGVSSEELHYKIGYLFNFGYSVTLGRWEWGEDAAQWWLDFMDGSPYTVQSSPEQGVYSHLLLNVVILCAFVYYTLAIIQLWCYFGPRSCYHCDAAWHEGIFAWNSAVKRQKSIGCLIGWVQRVKQGLWAIFYRLLYYFLWTTRLVYGWLQILFWSIAVAWVFLIGCYWVLGAVIMPERYLPTATLVLTLLFIMYTRVAYYWSKRAEVIGIIKQRLREKMMASVRRARALIAKDVCENTEIKALTSMTNSAFSDIKEVIPSVGFASLAAVIDANVQQTSELCRKLASDLGMHEELLKLFVAVTSGNPKSADASLRELATILKLCPPELLVSLYHIAQDSDPAARQKGVRLFVTQVCLILKRNPGSLLKMMSLLAVDSAKAPTASAEANSSTNQQSPSAKSAQDRIVNVMLEKVPEIFATVWGMTTNPAEGQNSLVALGQQLAHVVLEAIVMIRLDLSNAQAELDLIGDDVAAMLGVLDHVCRIMSASKGRGDSGTDTLLEVSAHILSIDDDQWTQFTSLARMLADLDPGAGAGAGAGAAGVSVGDDVVWTLFKKLRPFLNLGIAVHRGNLAQALVAARLCLEALEERSNNEPWRSYYERCVERISRFACRVAGPDANPVGAAVPPSMHAGLADLLTAVSADLSVVEGLGAWDETDVSGLILAHDSETMRVVQGILEKGFPRLHLALAKSVKKGYAEHARIWIAGGLVAVLAPNFHKGVDFADVRRAAGIAGSNVLRHGTHAGTRLGLDDLSMFFSGTWTEHQEMVRGCISAVRTYSDWWRTNSDPEKSWAGMWSFMCLCAGDTSGVDDAFMSQCGMAASTESMRITLLRKKRLMHLVRLLFSSQLGQLGEALHAVALLLRVDLQKKGAPAHSTANDLDAAAEPDYGEGTDTPDSAWSFHSRHAVFISKIRQHSAATEGHMQHYNNGLGECHGGPAVPRGPNPGESGGPAAAAGPRADGAAATISMLTPAHRLLL